MHSPVAVGTRRSDGRLEHDALLAEYVQRYRRLVERLCRILLSDSSDAEDAAQQTFLLAYQSLLAGTRPHHSRAWLCAIARRECWAREHRRRREQAVPPAEARAETDPAERTILRAELATMNAGLKDLPARQRQAIVLRELAGLSYSQLAAALEVTESAAGALLVRARRNLRDARLALVLLLSFPRPLRRFLRLGSGHARAAVGIQSAKAVAVVTLVTATTAVAGSTVVPSQPVARPSPKVGRAATETRHARTAPHHAVPRIRPAVHHVPRAARIEPTPANPAASPSRVSPPVPSSSAAARSAGGAGSPAAPPEVPAPSPGPKPRISTPTAPRPHSAAPEHPKPPPAVKSTPTATPAPAPATTTTSEPDQPVPPPPPTDTTETTSPPTDGPPGPGSNGQGPQGNNGNPGDPGDGDGQPGNGDHDDDHHHDGDHDGDHHHGHH